MEPISQIVLSLPSWMEKLLPRGQTGLSSRQRMELAVSLAVRNVEQGSGGPFGAAIFGRDSGRFVSAGVNLVVRENCSVLHAEIVAIMLAQKLLNTYDLSPHNLELVTSCEPCAMCLGAIPWSGLRGLVCGARDEDARVAGFDEGAKPADWAGELARRGVTVVRDVLRAEAAGVLEKYARAGGAIYNPGSQSAGQ